MRNEECLGARFAWACRCLEAWAKGEEPKPYRQETFTIRAPDSGRPQRYSANGTDQRGPGVEHPSVKPDHRSSVASDGYPPAITVES